MSREVKVGLLAIVAIFFAIWGYKFVKGQNLFKSTNTYYTTFSDVTALAPSSAVLINGYKVGQVTSIELSPDNVKKMNVFFIVDGDIPLPKDAIVQMKSEGVMGGKQLALSFKKPCSGGDCADSGQFIQGENIGLLASMMGVDEMSSYVDEATGGFQDVISKLGAPDSKGKVNDIIRNLDITITKLAELSEASTRLINASNRSLAGTLSNLNDITENLKNNDEKITNMLSNLDKVTSDLNAANLSNTISKANSMIDNTSNMMTDVNKTVTSLDASIKNLTELTNKMNNGEGSMGKLINDKDLYINLEETTRNLNLLLQDLRLNPKRYVNLSVFGKNKAYTLPEEDPALIENQN